MCGRYTLAKPMKSIESHFGPIRIDAAHSERYNIAPSQQAPVVLTRDKDRWLKPMAWGLVPSWAKDRPGGFINARAETAAAKPSFRAAFKTRRCLVPADGFFEWEQRNGKKIPHYFHLRSAGLFAFAGFYEEQQESTGPLPTFTILTTRANALVAPLHERMPVILAPEAYALWLSHSASADDLQTLFDPYSAQSMEQFVVSRDVNSPRNDGPACIAPADA
ncbi:MAG: SOS response-associated peptidase [Nitrospinaceae bacterium]|nr:MAG: SOS response-associated peptidase [Nitrospinaceae bacterium]